MFFKIIQVKGDVWLEKKSQLAWCDWKHILETWIRTIRHIWEQAMIPARPVIRKEKEHSLPLSLGCATTEPYVQQRTYEFIISEYRNRHWSVQDCSHIITNHKHLRSREHLCLPLLHISLQKWQNAHKIQSDIKHLSHGFATSYIWEAFFSKKKKISTHSAFPKFFPVHHTESLSFQATLPKLSTY